MKSKSIVAIVIAILCAVVLASGLVWKLLDDNTPPQEDPGSQTEQSSDSDDLTENDNNESDPEPDSDTEPENNEEPNPEPEPEPEPDPDPEPDSEPSIDPIDIDDPEVYKGNANVATLTKEEATAILNNKFMVLVNRDHRLPDDYAGIDLVSQGDHRLNKVTFSALNQLMDAGEDAGYNYVLYSGYRSYSHQYNNYYNKINYYKNSGYSEDEAIRLTNQYHAPPGASEHHTGLAADVCIPSIVNKYACLHENYEYTDEYKWFSANAHKYGFILRYRKGDEEITGYNFEPWHYRFVGVDIATEIYKRDITFEEYVEELENHLKQF